MPNIKRTHDSENPEAKRPMLAAPEYYDEQDQDGDEDDDSSYQDHAAQSDDEAMSSVASDASGNSSLDDTMQSLLNNKTFLIKFAKRLRRIKDTNADKYAKTVLRVDGTYKHYNYDLPHSQPTQEIGNGSGFIVSYRGQQFIMTNAHVVNDTYELSVKFADTAKTYPARTILIENDCDLSILHVDDPEFWQLAKPLPLCLGNPQLLDQIIRLGFPIGGEEVCLTEGSISRIEVHSYEHTHAELLQFQISAAQNPGSSGGPVVNRKDEIIGVSFQSERRGVGLHYTIPVQIMRRLLDAHIKSKQSNTPYLGFPDLAVYHLELDHKPTRESLGLEDNGVGVYIRHADPLCPSAKQLKEGDILLALDGTTINSDGTVETSFSKRLDMSYLYTSKHIGDTIVATVLRNGEKLELPITLRYRAKTTSMVSSIEYDKPPTYYIYCGVVFTNVTKNASDEEDIDETAGDDLQGLMAFAKKEPGQEFVIINTVLHNQYTVHTIPMKSSVVKEINGIPVRNLRHLIELIENCDKAHVIIKVNQNTVLGLPKLSKEAQAALLAPHQIFMDRSADLSAPPVFKPGCPEYEAQQAVGAVTQIDNTASLTSKIIDSAPGFNTPGLTV